MSIISQVFLILEQPCHPFYSTIIFFGDDLLSMFTIEHILHDRILSYVSFLNINPCFSYIYRNNQIVASCEVVLLQKYVLTMAVVM